MKQKRQLIALAAVVTILSGGLILHSCKKETNIIATPSFSIAKNFVGTYVGTSNCTGDSTFITINAGTDKTKAYYQTTFGLGNCQIIRVLDGNIKGDSLILPYAEFRDDCLDDYSSQGSAIYRNDSIFFTLTKISEDSTTSCFFYGKKIADTALINLQAQGQ